MVIRFSHTTATPPTPRRPVSDFVESDQNTPDDPR
jgi:hypothetical protein